jgi:RimJ/RimL family protein N-acetyltransferase
VIRSVADDLGAAGRSLLRVSWRDVRLRSNEIEVRPSRADDARSIETSPADPVTGRYFGRALAGPPIDTDDADAPSFTICRAGAPVGRIWFRPGVRPFEVGYYLRSDEWGRGIATQALTLVADWMLASNRADSIVLFTHPENVASQRVAVKAGFRRDGIEPAYAEFKDGTEDAIRFVRVRKRKRHGFVQGGAG